MKESGGREREGHDRGIDDSDETIRVCFGGLDNTNTVSEMQLCINIRIVMWGRQFPFGQLAKYMYLVRTRGFSWGYWARIGKRKGLGRAGMCHRHEPTNRFKLGKPKCDGSRLRRQRDDCSLFSIALIFLTFLTILEILNIIFRTNLLLKNL